MKAVTQFVTRQCTIAAFLCLGFALLQSFRIGQGLWQGSGLHGYFIEITRGHSAHIISVWASFVNMLIALCLAAFFGLTVRLSRRSLRGKEKLP